MEFFFGYTVSFLRFLIAEISGVHTVADPDKCVFFIDFLPIRLIWKLAINTGCGFAILLVLNWLSPYTGVLFDLNFLTSAIVGFLGLPGIILLFVVHLILEWGI